jgi:hypothetical protein
MHTRALGPIPVSNLMSTDSIIFSDSFSKLKVLETSSVAFQRHIVCELFIIGSADMIPV